MDAAAIADDLGPFGGIAAEMDQYEDRPTQREMARTIADALQRRGRRPARSGHRRRQVARLSASRAQMGRAQRRAHRRVDEHDQSAGAARSKGSAVSRARARRRAEGAFRAAQGLAQLSLPAAARAGEAHRRGSVRQFERWPRGYFAVGVNDHRWLARRSSPSHRFPKYGTKWRPSRISARARPVRTTSAVFFSQRAARRHRPMSSS